MIPILFAALLASQPPAPPGLVIPNPPPISPKAAEFKASLGTPMAQPLLVVAQTNLWLSIAKDGDQIALTWTNGSGPYQILGSPTLTGTWSAVGTTTMRHSATFSPGSNTFWRIQDQIQLLTLTATNPTTLAWTTPQLDMGDTLQPFTLQRRNNQPTLGNGLAPDDDTGWSNCAGTLSASCPIPVSGLSYTISDSDDPANSGGVPPQYVYRVRERTVNAVVVPSGMIQVQPSNNVAPGTLQVLRLMTSSAGNATADEITVTGVAVDSAGNFIAVGQLNGVGGKHTVDADLGDGIKLDNSAHNGNWGFAAKYRPDGTMYPGWPKVYRVTTDGIAIGNAATAVAVDSSDNVVVVGYISGNYDFGIDGPITNNGATDIFVVKYSPGGTPIWRRSYGTAGADKANDVKIDSSDNIVVVGTFATNLAIDFGDGPRLGHGLKDCFVVKLNSAGSLAWANTFGGVGDDIAQGVAVGGSLDQDIYVTGSFYSTVNFKGHVDVTDHNATAVYLDMFLVKYSGGTGAFQWIKTAGYNPMICYGNSVVIDKNIGPGTSTRPSGAAYDVIVTGAFGGQINLGGTNLVTLIPCDISKGCSIAVFFARFGSDGTHVWSRAFGGYGTSTVDQGNGVAVSALGNIALGVSQGGSVVYYDAFYVFGVGSASIADLAEFNSSGTTLWSPRAITPNSTIRSVTFSPSGMIVVAGDCAGIQSPQGPGINFGNGAVATGVGARAGFVAIYTP